MSIPEWCERLQNTWLSTMISGSIWGYPIVAALHVLAIAVFGGPVLWTHLRTLGALRAVRRQDAAPELRVLKFAGLLVVLVTGALLFAAGAARYYESTSFRVKMALLILLALNAAALRGHRKLGRLYSAIALALWAALIFAARGIAYF